MAHRRESGSAAPASKSCESCGRKIEWRRKWERDWAEVRYCSKACKSRKLKPVDAELERAILGLLAKRSATATICPSEAARLVAADSSPTVDVAGSGVASSGVAGSVMSPQTDSEVWRQLMEPARGAARRLVAAGKVEITQKGQVVDPSTAKGPIRIRRATP